MYKKTIFLCLSLLCLTGCSPNSKVGGNVSDLLSPQYRYDYERVTLIEDNVVAFGKLAQPSSDLPSDAVVVAGEKYSYVITEGAMAFQSLFSQLEPKYIRFHHDLSFYHPYGINNQFSGTIRFDYAPPSGLSAQEQALFKSYGVAPCACGSSSKSSANSFELKLSGLIYPVANNIKRLQPLSKAYKVSVYQTEKVKKRLPDTPLAEKIALFPIALAVDVIALPFQGLGIVYQP